MQHLIHICILAGPRQYTIKQILTVEGRMKANVRRLVKAACKTQLLDEAVVP